MTEALNARAAEETYQVTRLKACFFSFFWAQTRSFKEPIVSQKVTMKEEHPFKEQLNIICLGGWGVVHETLFSHRMHTFSFHRFVIPQKHSSFCPCLSSDDLKGTAERRF